MKIALFGDRNSVVLMSCSVPETCFQWQRAESFSVPHSALLTLLAHQEIIIILISFTVKHMEKNNYASFIIIY